MHFRSKRAKQSQRRLVGIMPLMFIMSALACAAHQSTHAPVPPPAPEIHVIHSRPEGCTIKNNVATCECLSATTRIDSKTGKSVVICKVNVKEVSR